MLNGKFCGLGVPVAGQWIKNWLWQLWSLWRCGLDPWPGAVASRIQCCHCCGFGHSCELDLIPSLGASICYRCGHQEKKICLCDGRATTLYPRRGLVFELTSWGYSFGCVTDAVTSNESHGYIILDALQLGKRKETELPCFSHHPWWHNF